MTTKHFKHIDFNTANQVERTLAHYREIKAKVEKELEIEADDQKKVLSVEFEFGDTLDSI